MKKLRRAPLPDDVCLCIPGIRVCVWCQNKPAPETVEEADGLEFDSHESPNLRSNGNCRSSVDDNPPWNVNELPPHLRGLGYRGADQDGYDGSEWVSPEEHNAGNLIEAARELLDAEEV